MIQLLPTFPEVVSTTDWIALGVKVSAALAAALWFFKIVLDAIEDRIASWQAERDIWRTDDARYRRALETASRIETPWLPARPWW